jgi:hypothetical protein
MRTSTGTSGIVIRWRARLSRPLLVATLAAGLVVAGSPAAQAQSRTNADSAGDMGAYDDETEETSPAPSEVLSDVLRTTMNHTATRISLRVQFADLQQVDDGHGLSVQIVTNEGVRRELEVFADSDDWAGGTWMWRGSDGEPVRCAIWHSIDYTANTIAVGFPRRCASSPRWVKFRVMGFRLQGDTQYDDDALRDEPWLDGNLVQSLRVFRG